MIDQKTEQRQKVKPKIGTTVYCIYEDSIAKYKVGYISKDGFIIDEFFDYVDFDALLWWYEDFGKTWFRSLKEAKAKLLHDVQSGYFAKPNARIKKVNDSYWEVE